MQTGNGTVNALRISSQPLIIAIILLLVLPGLRLLLQYLSLLLGTLSYPRQAASYSHQG